MVLCHQEPSRGFSQRSGAGLKLLRDATSGRRSHDFRGRATDNFDRFKLVIRVFYDVSGTTVEVLAIVAKSNAESWLAQFGNPE
jgi:hypothetical protein